MDPIYSRLFPAEMGGKASKKMSSLYHKEIMQLKQGDILGHEWMGVVEEVGTEVTNVKPGDRVVASFQVSCGECSFCKEGLSSMCDRTNTSALQEKLYGKPFVGFLLKRTPHSTF